MKKINMPIISPVPIKSRGTGFFRGLWTWATEKRSWRVEEEYLLYFEGRDYIIPKGFVFDGASIPKLLQSFISPTGLLFIPALFHDYGYKESGYAFEDFTIDPKTQCTWIKVYPFEFRTKSQIDGVFKRMNTKINGVATLSNIAWLGVKFGGGFAWRGHRNVPKSRSDSMGK